LHVLHSNKSFDTFHVTKESIPIAKIDNSRPSKGNNAKVAPLIPNNAASPIPQAAHPGANAARNTPTEPANPVFLDPPFLPSSFQILTL